MEHLLVRCRGCPTPVRESLDLALTSSRAGELRSADDPIDPKLLTMLVYCDSETQWELLADLVDDVGVVVAMIVDLDLDHYARALAAGAAGVIHYDTAAYIIVSVLQSAVRGEVVLPAFAARKLAANWTDDSVPDTLTDHETELLRSLSAGDRITDMAESFAYSERTIRRQLQSMYLKLGAGNRTDAIRIGARLR